MIIVKTFTCLSDVRIRKILTLLKKSHKKIIFSGGIFPKVNAEEFKLSNVRYNYKLRNNSRSGILSLTLLNFRDIVNLKKVERYDSKYVEIEKIKLPLSRTRKLELSQALDI